MSFKKLIVGAALSLSSFALAAPPHRAVPNAPPVMNEARSDRFDVAQGRMLLRELDGARFDRRAQVSLDHRIAAFIDAELAESRSNRRERRDLRELTRLQLEFSRVHGRFDRRAVAEKRRVLLDAVNIAERDLRSGAGERFSRR